MRRFLAAILPMEQIERCLFVDLVSGASVGVYRERITGRVVMAESHWAWFRVPAAQREG